MPKQSYEAKLAVLEAMAAEEVRKPNMPVDVFIQELFNLGEWVKQDKAALTKVGLDWAEVEDMTVRAKALRYAQSVWMRKRYSQEEAQAEWDRLAPGAYELKNDLEADFRFAFRERPDLLSKVAAIEEGTGHSDMVQDLNDLAVLGKANLPLLEKINVGKGKLDSAATKSTEMAELLAKVNGIHAEGNPECDMRNRAYTHAKTVVDAIRNTGRYVFRKDDKRLKGYRSEYHRR